MKLKSDNGKTVSIRLWVVQLTNMAGVVGGYVEDGMYTEKAEADALAVEMNGRGYADTYYTVVPRQLDIDVERLMNVNQPPQKR